MNNTCVCPSYFSDASCGTLVNCALYIATVYGQNQTIINPCNNGACPFDGSGVLCVCNAGYTGSICQSIINNCASTPCANGATCANGLNKFNCTCAPGFTGTTCGTQINNCASNPCGRGTCNNQVNAFTCTCNAGYTGTLCNTPINYCSNNPCQNGGTCTSLATSYSCACPTGFSGPTCTTSLGCDVFPLSLSLFPAKSLPGQLRFMHNVWRLHGVH